MVQYFRGSSFQNFPGEDTPDDPLTLLTLSALVCSAPPPPPFPELSTRSYVSAHGVIL